MNKAIPKSFTTFTGKHLRCSFFFNKVAAKNTFFYRTPQVAACAGKHFSFSYAGVTLSHFLCFLFCYHKKYQCNHVNHVKAHYFQLLSICNSQHIILTSSLKNCTGTVVDQTIRERQTENWLKAKYKAEALQKGFLKSEIKLLCSVYF